MRKQTFEEYTFPIDAGRDFIYAQRETLISAVVAGLHTPLTTQEIEAILSGGAPDPSPMLHIRAHNDVHRIHGRIALLLFKRQRPEETEEETKDLIDHGLCDLRISLEALAESRTWVTVECSEEDFRPAARAVLQVFAERYPEAKRAIESQIEAEPAGQTDGRRNPRAGRRRYKTDEWARQQVHCLDRQPAEVYDEWLGQIPAERRKRLSDPRDSFQKILRRTPRRSDGEQREQKE
jgi:hypothetical protein